MNWRHTARDLFRLAALAVLVTGLYALLQLAVYGHVTW